MTHIRTLVRVAASLAVGTFLMTGCGHDMGGNSTMSPAGSGGSTTMGVAAAGGVRSTGGSRTLGGAMSMGGVAAAGGVVAASGGSGTGGARATGGAAGSGGMRSTGGGFADAGMDAGGAEGGSPPDGGACHPILQNGKDTGFDACADGSQRRRQNVTCTDRASSPDAMCPAGSPSCASDADCTAQPNGYCPNSRHIAGYCGCFYGGCMKDSDCGAGSICECGVLIGTCVPATCTTAASCEGLACLRTRKASDPNVCHLADPGGGLVYACQKPADECSGDADCEPGLVCRLVGDHRICGSDFCPV